MFRLATRRVFLTYPHCDLTIAEAYAQFEAMRPIKYAIVSIEAHADGTPHLHAAIQFRTKIDITSPNYFDLKIDTDDRQAAWHGHYQSARNWGASINYVKKDGNFQEFGSLEGGPDEQAIAEVAAACTSQLEFAEICLRRKVPYPYMNLFWQATHRPNDSIVPTGWTPNSLACIATPIANLQLPSNMTSTVLVGPSGCGKTTWAMLQAPKPALLVTHLDQLHARSDDIQSIIFDDMAFSHMPRESQIHLVDRYVTRAIHCRYKPAIVPAGIVKIFTANKYPFTDNEPAIARRLTYYNMYGAHMVGDTLVNLIDQ